MANHSIVRRLIRDSLRTWVSEMHIDGFRFDLAAVLNRDEDGTPLKNPPLLWEIESDPVLAPTKIIAEAWDIEQYKLGSFVGDRWAEWNGRFRDDVRQFVKGDKGLAGTISQRLLSSPDLFGTERKRDPNRSINFITCHDGFTMNDLVSYNEKHNLANKEDNRDGTNANYSWNSGTEGDTEKQEIENLRAKQVRNFLTLLMISQGTPMMLMGDEVRRTQNGNNNAYCQDNEIGWFDWDLVEKHSDTLAFTKRLIQFNLSTPYFQENHFWNHGSETQVIWHGTKLNQPDWSYHSHTLAFTLNNPAYDHQLHIIVNAFWEPLEFELPPIENRSNNLWELLVDTSFDQQEEQVIDRFNYTAKERSVVVLRCG
ncbi:MAG: hypothetical protein AAFO07_16315 [Bacteroidota bacterium]